VFRITYAVAPPGQRNASRSAPLPIGRARFRVPAQKADETEMFR